jgi:hypothetical protein
VSGRHVGGVRGTRFLRADCPACGRDTAGGNAARDRRTICLKPHKVLVPGEGNTWVRAWCIGSGSLVTPRDYLPRSA